MSDTKTLRHRASRDEDSRRLTPEALFENLRDLPPHMVPEGMELLWATEEVMGQYNPNVTTRLNRDSYVPMTTKEFPSLAMKTLPGREAKDELIRWEGQVLLGRPKQLGQRQRQQQFDVTRSQLSAAGVNHRKAVQSHGMAADTNDVVRVDRERARPPQFEE
jgi:hypothetical protein